MSEIVIFEGDIQEVEVRLEELTQAVELLGKTLTRQELVQRYAKTMSWR